MENQKGYATRRAMLAALFICGLASCARPPAPGAPPAPLSDATLKKVAQAELDIETVTQSAIQSLDTLFSAGSITAQDVQTVGGILKKVNIANGQAIQITKNLAQLDPNARSSLRDIVVPLLNAVNAALVDGTITIKDPTARASVSASLSAIATSLTIIQARLQ